MINANIASTFAAVCEFADRTEITPLAAVSTPLLKFTTQLQTVRFEGASSFPCTYIQRQWISFAFIPCFHKKHADRDNHLSELLSTTFTSSGERGDAMSYRSPVESAIYAFHVLPALLCLFYCCCHFLYQLCQSYLYDPSIMKLTKRLKLYISTKEKLSITQIHTFFEILDKRKVNIFQFS